MTTQQKINKCGRSMLFNSILLLMAAIFLMPAMIIVPLFEFGIICALLFGLSTINFWYHNNKLKKIINER